MICKNLAHFESPAFRYAEMRVRSLWVILCFAIMLLSVVTHARKDCADDFSEISKLEKNSNSKKRQSFIFKNEKRKVGEEFHLKYPAYPDRLFPARFERISDQDYELRKRLKEIKTASRPNSKQEREVGELVVRSMVGKPKSARYTSDSLKEISQEAQEAAAEANGLFSNPFAITKITDIHTHPNLGPETQITFSANDMEGYITLKEQIEAQKDTSIDYRAILIPNCNDCEDIILVMDL